MKKLALKIAIVISSLLMFSCSNMYNDSNVDNGDEVTRKGNLEIIKHKDGSMTYKDLDLGIRRSKMHINIEIDDGNGGSITLGTHNGQTVDNNGDGTITIKEDGKSVTLKAKS